MTWPRSLAGTGGGAALLLFLACPPTALGQEMPSIPPGVLEGRPANDDLSPLQVQIDAAAPGATVEVEPGEYVGRSDRRQAAAPPWAGGGRGSSAPGGAASSASAPTA